MNAQGTDRRDLLKKAAVGGAVIWTAPVVLSTAAAAAGSTPPGCVIVPTTVATSCGPESWTTHTSFDVAACPGPLISLDGLNGLPFSGGCVPIASGVEVTGGGAFDLTLTVTSRDVCGGLILGGPTTFAINADELCAPPPGAEPGAGAPDADPNATITITLGDRSIEVPTAG